MGLIAGLPGSIMVTPSTEKLYSQTPAGIAPTLADQTPSSPSVSGSGSFIHRPRRETAFALGAFRRKMALLSAFTSGEMTGAGRGLVV